MKRFLPLSLACFTLLCSCGTEPKAPFVPKEDFNENFRLLEEGNVTVVNPTLESTTYYYGPDCVYRSFDDTSRSGFGYMTLADQGMFSFSLENDKVQLGNTLSLSPSDHASLMLYSPSLLSDNASFRKKSDGTWASTHENTLVTFAYIAGLGINLSSTNGYTILTKGTMTGEEKEGGILDFNYSFSTSSYSFSYEISFTNIGSTQNKTIESYMASNPTLTSPVSWSEAQKSSIAAVYGDASEVPFPAASPYSAFSASSSTAVFLDYGKECKAMVADYQKKLEKAGFVLNADRSTLSGDSSVYLYEKDKQVEDVNAGKDHVTYEAVFGFVPNSALNASDAARFPNGKFILNLKLYRYTFHPATQDSLNLYLQYAGLDSKAVPGFAFQEQPTKMFGADKTEVAKDAITSQGSTAAFDHYYVLGLSFASLATVKKEMANYVNSLVLSGFEKNESASSDSISIYTKKADGYPNGITVQISAEGGSSSTDTPWLDVEYAW